MAKEAEGAGEEPRPQPEPKPVASRKKEKAEAAGAAPRTNTKATRKKSESKQLVRGPKLFPTLTFEEALELGLAIQQHAAGQQVRRLTLFDKMGKKSTTGPARHLIRSSAKYGITDGSDKSEFLSLTKDGALATSPEAKPREVAAARFRLAIESVEVFKGLYDRLKGNKIPSREVLSDYAGDLGVSAASRLQCVDIFLGNVKFVGVLRVLSGAERIVSVDHMLDELPAGVSEAAVPAMAIPSAQPAGAEGQPVDFSKVCFFISPIGDEGTEHRKHADMMLGSLVEKALVGQDLQVIRADKIAKPGMISAQVINYILRSKVVVADLSYHNPNVFYELALRHTTGLPTVHIIRSEDKLPFDLANFRTVSIDTADKYNLVARLDSYRSEIANHVRQAIAAGTTQDNPIRAYQPSLKVQIGD